MICVSCGGIIGRDCFNPQECAWITQQMIADEAVQSAAYKQQEREYYAAIEREHEKDLQEQFESYCMDDLRFDPIALGM